MKRTSSVRAVFFALTFCAAPVVYGADEQVINDAESSLENAGKFLDDGDYARALEEANWARDYIQQLVDAASVDKLPQEVNGLKLDKVESNTTMGVNVIAATYGDGAVRVSVSKFGQSGNPLGALGALAGMMGGPKKFRAGRFTVMEQGNGQMNMNAGDRMVMFEADAMGNADLRRFVTAFERAARDMLGG